jgi:hypothetical protein
MLPWMLVIVASLVAVVIAFSASSGSCFGVDAAGDPICRSDPDVGWPIAWAIAGVALVASAFAMWRIVRLDVRRSHGDRD